MHSSALSNIISELMGAVSESMLTSTVHHSVSVSEKNIDKGRKRKKDQSVFLFSGFKRRGDVYCFVWYYGRG